MTASATSLVGAPSKTHHTPTCAYTFIARADDGMRIWLDGALLLDKWTDQAVTEYRVPRAPIAGEHDVQVECYESRGIGGSGDGSRNGNVICRNAA